MKIKLDKADFICGLHFDNNSFYRGVKTNLSNSRRVQSIVRTSILSLGIFPTHHGLDWILTLGMLLS